MAVHITYFVHGTTADNLAGKYTGLHDIPLSPLGEQQSVELKELIQGKQFDVVICSDLLRAVRSAELTFGGVVEIIQDARLRECDLGQMDRSATELIDPLMNEHVSKPFPDGESYEDVERRMRSLVAELQTRFEGKRVAIVAHRAPQLALDVILKKKTWQQAIAEDWRHEKRWQPGWSYEA